MAKSAPKAAAGDEGAASAPAKSKKKLILMIAIFVAALAAGGGGAWFFLKPDADPDAPPKPAPVKPPVFIVLEQFTVNLQPENGEQFLQTALTLQVADQVHVDNIKLYLPLVRSRLLLLLSSKKASEISSIEGKKKLAEEIIAQVKQPFTPHAKPQEVTGVFFTSFVIQ